ncbi:haloacid dehalogenase type II [Amycolatopsis acidicola]|uniref:Haloacid dehalogenase type II n=1 Tax=Amycolatopsis acidicola TaxID=2596893 RepID=A0A5N0UZA1_9PSEU|nr:haloacid dehalogenase type II [Amycolatopsis acidicola]KAA9159345.1 haloacid dehalogenase type II [Amycolatopsis acidicola]
MTELRDIDVIVFDVLGTLVDEPSGLRAAIREAAPEADQERLLALWQQHIATEQGRIAQGLREYASSEVIDAEAAQLVADTAGLNDQAAIARLATAGQRLPAWSDSVAGLGQLSQRRPVLALSNAGHTALLRLNAHAGLRWHQALSSETVQAYKPAPEIYRLALATAGCPADRVLMVAAHAWDLRGAQSQGMRTAYVHRPVGDPPRPSDVFDGQFENLGELITSLR